MELCHNAFLQNRDLHSRLISKEKLIRELRDDLESSKENIARQAALVQVFKSKSLHMLLLLHKLIPFQSLRDRVRNAEDSSGTLETVTARGSITIQTLQKENREAQERILELEARVRYGIMLIIIKI